MFGRSAPIVEPSIPIYKRCGLFLKYHWRGFVLFLIPFIFSFLINDQHIPGTSICGYTMALMGIFWVTEAIPATLTSMMPIAIFPLFGVMDSASVCRCYVNDTIMMFFASIMLAFAVEMSGLHFRLALSAIKIVGYSHKKLLFGLSAMTTLVSMWITNIAATTMVVPINFALLRDLEKHGLCKLYDIKDGHEVATDITSAYFCSAAYCSTIGGIGTIVGTGTNLVFKGLYETAHPKEPERLSFPLFSAFSIPYMLALFIAHYVWTLFFHLGFLRPNSKTARETALPQKGIDAAKASVNKQWKTIGRMTTHEIFVALFFITCMVLLFTKSPGIFWGWADVITADVLGKEERSMMKPSAPSMLAVFVMIVFPRNFSAFRYFYKQYKDELPKTKVKGLIDWSIAAKQMPWSFLLLIGGGFALAEASKKVGLTIFIGHALKSMKTLPESIVILIFTIITIVLTNFTSNVAIANILCPIAMEVAKSIGGNALLLNCVCGFCASFCFCLPVGTPPNLVVAGIAKIPTSKMLAYGSGLTIATIFISWFFFAIYFKVVFP